MRKRHLSSETSTSKNEEGTKKIQGNIWKSDLEKLIKTKIKTYDVMGKIGSIYSRKFVNCIAESKGNRQNRSDDSSKEG